MTQQAAEISVINFGEPQDDSFFRSDDDLPDSHVQHRWDRFEVLSNCNSNLGHSDGTE